MESVLANFTADCTSIDLLAKNKQFLTISEMFVKNKQYQGLPLCCTFVFKKVFILITVKLFFFLEDQNSTTVLYEFEYFTLKHKKSD